MVWPESVNKMKAVVNINRITISISIIRRFSVRASMMRFCLLIASSSCLYTDLRRSARLSCRMRIALSAVMV